MIHDVSVCGIRRAVRLLSEKLTRKLCEQVEKSTRQGMVT